MFSFLWQFALVAALTPASTEPTPAAKTLASPVREDCTIEELLPSTPPLPAIPEPGRLSLPIGADPLSWLRPLTTQAITLEHDHVPLAELPEGATQEMIAASLSGIDRLRTLDLRRSGLYDLGPVGGLERLQRLIVHDTRVVDLGPLSHLITLEHLDARTTPVADVIALRNVVGLKELELDETSISDVRPLSGLRCLERLGLAATAVSDIRPLARLERLRTLRLDHTRVRNVLPLAKLERLEELSLSGTKVRSVAPLSRLAKLKVLSLADTEVRDVRPLMRLTGLERVDVRGTSLSLEQIEALEEALPFTVVVSSIEEEAIEQAWEFEALRYRAEIGATRFNLARAMWEAEGRQQEALDLAVQARSDFERNGAFSREEREAVDRWLRERQSAKSR